jgi:hypothetical protein
MERGGTRPLVSFHWFHWVALVWSHEQRGIKPRCNVRGGGNWGGGTTTMAALTERGGMSHLISSHWLHWVALVWSCKQQGIEPRCNVRGGGIGTVEQ